LKKKPVVGVLGILLMVFYGQSVFFWGPYVFSKDTPFLLGVLFGGLWILGLLFSAAVIFQNSKARQGLVYLNLVLGFCYLLIAGSLLWFFLSVLIALLLYGFRMCFLSECSLKTSWKSILVIDDDEMTSKLIRPTLMKSGYSVLTALTGEEGMIIAGQQKPDLILLDVILPRMKGRAVCQKLKSNPETSDIPIVFLTAKDSQDDVMAEMSLGAIAHLSKPVQPDLLLRRIKEILA
jgi:CheY-like chemotaxis protein